MSNVSLDALKAACDDAGRRYKAAIQYRRKVNFDYFFYSALLKVKPLRPPTSGSATSALMQSNIELLKKVAQLDQDRQTSSQQLSDAKLVLDALVWRYREQKSVARAKA